MLPLLPSPHTQRRAQQTYQELSAKERLLQQQNSVRESVLKKQSGASAGEPLREGWKEIKDPKTGSTYYWNKVLGYVAEPLLSAPPQLLPCTSPLRTPCLPRVPVV